MAEDSDLEKTEQPSQRRLDQARERGEVARSRELSTFAILLVGGGVGVAPLLLLAVACLGNQDSGIPAFEQLVSLGAAIQNLLLGATAMGFGSGLTSGQAMDAEPLRALFRLGSNESAVCFVNIGTVSEHKCSKRARPERNAFVSTLN